MKLNPGASWTLRLELEIEPLPPPAAVAGSGVERFGGNFAFVGRPAWVKQRYLLFLVYTMCVFRTKARCSTAKGPKGWLKVAQDVSTGNCMRYE
jgi:hypothetical protein